MRHRLNVALVHDHLMKYGGAERVLLALHHLFPTAPIYTLFYDQRVADSYFPGADVRASSLQKLPRFTRRRFRTLAPFAVSAIENMDLRAYDIVISSSAFFAKGVITRPDAVHICYCHTPTKYLWDVTDITRDNEQAPLLAQWARNTAVHMLRMWDFNAASRVDHFIANSRYVKRAIEKYYRKDAFVVYPPVEKEALHAGDRANPLSQRSVVGSLPKDFFLVVSQLYPHKQVELAVQAFSKLSYPLVIVGGGPQRHYLKSIAGPTTVFLGRQPDSVVRECYERCYAYVHPGEEDFGISMVEAMLFGKPVLAYRGGGAQESIIEGVSGEFFDDLHPAVLADGVRRLREHYDTYDANVIASVGKRFSKERFGAEFKRVLRRVLRARYAH
jgi:glycosyltransferase involved in cell wall biosynthesis